MTPIGEHISINLLPEPEQKLIVEKEPLVKVSVKEVSPDISVPMKANDEVYVRGGKQIVIEGEVFIHVDNIVLIN